MSNSMLVFPARAVHAAARRFIKEEDAGPLVEFAFVAPMLMLIIMAIVDFSLALLTRNNLVSAVREGARLGAVEANPPWSDSNAGNRIRARVEAYLRLGGKALPADFDVNDDIVLENPEPGLLRVRIKDYRYTPITPILDKVTFPPLSAAAVYRWERS